VRLHRLLSITMMLINRRRVTAPQLSEHFGVSIRTIYRDIEAIESAGIPVISYQGHEGGFCIMDNYRLSRQLLTFEDMLSILSTLKGVNGSLQNRELNDVIEKIECLIPEEREEEFERRIEQVAFDMVPWSNNKKWNDNFHLINRAVTEQKLISFNYTSYQSATGRRAVEPMTLLFKVNCWYLFGYCLMRNDYRLFKLSRMREISILDERFIRRNGSWRDSIATGDSSVNRPQIRLELLFKARARIKVEEYFEPEQMTILENGDFSVIVTMPDDEWVHSWLLSYGDEVEVLSPEHIRNRFMEILKKINDTYLT